MFFLGRAIKRLYNETDQEVIPSFIIKLTPDVRAKMLQALNDDKFDMLLLKAKYNSLGIFATQFYYQDKDENNKK